MSSAILTRFLSPPLSGLSVGRLAPDQGQGVLGVYKLVRLMSADRGGLDEVELDGIAQIQKDKSLVCCSRWWALKRDKYAE